MRPLARLLVARARLAPPHRPVVLVSLTNDAPALVPPNPIPVREISTAPRTWNATAEIDLSTSNGFDGPGGNGSSSPKQSSGDGWAKAGRFLSLVVSAATAAGVVLWGFKLVGAYFFRKVFPPVLADLGWPSSRHCSVHRNDQD